ncbi:hypothetical protein OQA88_5198 [Cercophora sp. LCS_1]
MSLQDGLLPAAISPRSLSPHRCIAALVFLAALYCLWKYQRRRQATRETERAFALKHGCLPPPVWGAKFPLGLDYLFRAFKHAHRKQILSFFIDVFDESGATFQQHLLGARAIGTIDPANIEAVLSTNFKDYNLGLRTPTFSPLLGNGIFTQDGAEWKHSRQLLRPHLASTKHQNFEYLKRCVEGMIAAIPEDGIVDLQPLCFRLTFDTTMVLLFGASVSAGDWGQVSGQESAFSKAFNFSQEYLSHRGRLGGLYWLLNSRAFRDANRVCHDFVDGAVKKALAAAQKGEGRNDADTKRRSFVEELVRETQDTRVIRDQCLNVLLAGRDTTGCCLQWTFRLLARHQRVLRKVRAEIAEISGLGANAPPPTRDDIKRMKYLHLVIKEALRLYPSVPVNSREAIRLTTLPVGGGPDGKSSVLVRPGEGVGYSVYAMHRRKDLYGNDAEEFRPERWQDGSLDNIGCGYLPFNFGPRLCLGKEFALLEVSYTVARVIQVFTNIEAAPDEVPVEVGREKQTLTLVVSSGDACRVCMKTG